MSPVLLVFDIRGIFQEGTLAHELRAVIYQTTRRHTPEDSDDNIPHHEPLNIIPLPSSLDFCSSLASNLGMYFSTSIQ
jgi:hypothetical protein